MYHTCMCMMLHTGEINMIYTTHPTHHPGPVFLNAAAQRTADTLQEATPQNLSNFFWSLAQFEHTPPVHVLRACIDTCVGLVGHPLFNPQACSNVIWAMATIPRAWECVKGACCVWFVRGCGVVYYVLCVCVCVDGWVYFVCMQCCCCCSCCDMQVLMYTCIPPHTKKTQHTKTHTHTQTPT